MISLQVELKIFKKKPIKTHEISLDGSYESVEGVGSNNNSINKMDNLIELASIYYNNALDLIKDNNISKAVELIEKSLEYNYEDVQALNLMGIFQYMFCNFDKALLTWNKSLICDNTNNRARYYLESLNSEKFKGFLEYYNLSISYIDKFEYKAAIELLLEINKTNKDLIEPYALIGNCYYALQEHELAKKYLNQALAKDIDNIKYLKYLNKINTNIPLKSINNNLKYKILFTSMALVIVIISLAFYQKYNRDIKELSSELDKSKSEDAKVKEQVKNKKDLNNIDKNNIVEIKDDTLNEDLSFSGSESEIFENAMKDFINGQYSESINMFKYLIDTGNNEDLVAESIYYIAVSFEKEKDNDKAGEYYSAYIDKYYGQNYYDDSLYNYGLMLHEKGDIEASKQVLYKLKKEVPESIFINTKVESILDS